MEPSTSTRLCGRTDQETGCYHNHGLTTMITLCAIAAITLAVCSQYGAIGGGAGAMVGLYTAGAILAVGALALMVRKICCTAPGLRPLPPPAARPVNPFAGPAAPPAPSVNPLAGPVAPPAPPVNPFAGPVAPPAPPVNPFAGPVAPPAPSVNPFAGPAAPPAPSVNPFAEPAAPPAPVGANEEAGLPADVTPIAPNLGVRILPQNAIEIWRNLEGKFSRMVNEETGFNTFPCIQLPAGAKLERVGPELKTKMALCRDAAGKFCVLYFNLPDNHLMQKPLEDAEALVQIGVCREFAKQIWIMADNMHVSHKGGVVYGHAVVDGVEKVQVFKPGDDGQYVPLIPEGGLKLWGAMPTQEKLKDKEYFAVRDGGVIKLYKAHLELAEGHKNVNFTQLFKHFSKPATAAAADGAAAPHPIS